MFLFGDGVETDAGEASKWFLAASEKGLADAQYALGVLYDEGRGLARNPEEAGKWVRKAAEGGHEDARRWLAAHGADQAPPPSPAAQPVP
ncbi:MAG: sel1 repeat family protein [Rhodocyclales bacterium]|nr:sel1 repeat family protein [Rhodocyclales bacterium]